MYFPTAGIACHPLVPFAVAAGLSFFTSMGGISGAFLLLPFQMSVLGYVNPSVSATNQFYNLIATPSGIWRYRREGRLVWPLAGTIAAGTLPGVLVGAFVRIYLLPDPGHFKIFAGLVLLYIGLRLAVSVWQERAALGRRSGRRTADTWVGGCQTLVWNGREIRLRFQERDFALSTRSLLLLSLIVGLVGGIYGIGGGAIMSPFLVSLFGLPVYVVAGATLCATALTSFAGVVCYWLLAPFHAGTAVAPDWRLGLLIGLGGMCGMYAGARCQKFVPASVIKVMLVLVLCFTALHYLMQAL